MQRNKGYTLLELLLVISLLSIAFSLIGLIYINNIKGNIKLTAEVNQNIKYLSVYNQIQKQFYSYYLNRKINIKLENNRLSFYTGYPIFYGGIVRAEYYTELSEDGNYYLIYEEFPYPDGKLGFEGSKKLVLGKFKNVNFNIMNKNKIFSSFKNKKFPNGLILEIDEKKFYIQR